MGIDLSWTAIPEETELFRALRGGRFPEDIEALSSVYTGNRPWRDEFQVLAEAVRDARPDLRSRTLTNGGRTYEAITWLISDGFRRGVRGPFQDLCAQTLFPNEVIHPDSRTTIGFPIGYLSPAQVAAGSAALEAISEAAFFAHFDPEGMERAAVYKFRADRAVERRRYIWDDFVAQRDLFRRVAAMGDEGLLVMRG